MHNNSALILVDLQNDFFPGGKLAVPNADRIFPLANDILDSFPLVIATKDWHPSDHGSFVTAHAGKKLYDVVDLNGVSQILWPEHCIQESKGSEFHPKLNQDKIHKIIYKGTSKLIDSYSTFFDNAHQKSTGLETYLKDQGITDIYIMGLATDYCVLYSVLDAIELNFNTFVIQDGCYGIDANPGDINRALEKMKAKGAHLISSDNIMGKSHATSR